MIPQSSPSLDTALARSIRYFRLHISNQADIPRRKRNAICALRAWAATLGSRATKSGIAYFDDSRARRLGRSR